VANIAQRGGWLRWDGNRRCLEIVSGSLFQYDHSQGRIQPVRLGGRAISDIFASQVSSRLRYRFKRDEANYTTLLWQNNGRYNDLTSQMLFSELYKSMVNKVTFVGFRGEIVPSAPTPLDPPLTTTSETSAVHWWVFIPGAWMNRMYRPSPSHPTLVWSKPWSFRRISSTLV